MPVAARNPFAIAVIAAAVLAAHVGTADAQRKPSPACGIKSIPFIEGKEWVYMAVAPPEEVRTQALKIAANKPKQPDEFVIRVTAVQALEDGVTEITLDEVAHEVTRTTTITCTKDALDVSPESFLFTGEPGGSTHYELSEVTRAEGNHSYVFQLGTLRVPEWIENIQGTFTRAPSEGVDVELVPGSMDLQRVVKRGAPEEVTTAFGTFKATPVQIELVGSVALDFGGDELEKFSIPAGTLNKLWVADNVGVVQIANSNGHNYQLSDYRDSTADPAAPAPAGQTPAQATKPAQAKPQAPAQKPAPAQQPAQTRPAAAPAQPKAPARKPAPAQKKAPAKPAPAQKPQKQEEPEVELAPEAQPAPEVEIELAPEAPPSR